MQFLKYDIKKQGKYIWFTYRMLLNWKKKTVHLYTQILRTCLDIYDLYLQTLQKIFKNKHSSLVHMK